MRYNSAMSARLAILSILLLMAACAPQPASSRGTLPPPAVTVLAFQSPTPAPVPTSTPTVAELVYPYTIDGLRKHVFQSGKITLLSELEKTKIYTRYRIAYPSDGLRITGILQIPREGKPPFPVIVLNHGFFARS